MNRIQRLAYRATIATAFAALPLSLAACSYSPPGPAVEQAVGVNLDAPRVQLLEAGSGQLQVVSFADIGATQDLTVEVSTGFSQDIVRADAAAGFRSSTLNPTTTSLPLSVTVDKASEAAEDQAEATRNVFATVGMSTTTASTALDSAEGFQFGWRGLDSGQVTTLRLAAPLTASDASRTQMEEAIGTLVSLPVVFPTEPIGPGARWSVDSRVTGKNSMLQTVTYRLESLNDGVATLSVDLTQRPSLGALSLEGQTDASGTALSGELTVLDSTSTSQGQLRVDLTKPLPVSGTVDVTTTVVYGQKDSDSARVVHTNTESLSFAEAKN